jgi:threonine aldolase
MATKLAEPSIAAADECIDLRSDTVTRPTAEMYEQMQVAPVGDDGLDHDPTAQDLEDLVASILGKEAALFVPSCTMANLIATLIDTQRGEQIVLEADSHMYTTERASVSFSGMFYVPVPGVAGAMNMDVLNRVLLTDRFRLRTPVVCMETSHNNAAGAVLPLEHMRSVSELARSAGCSVHLDGARLFNAAVALSVKPDRIAKHADTVSVCMSKGLSAPMGALLAGTAGAINKARALRKMLGGAQRQIGVVAAAAIVGMQTMIGRLVEDHERAAQLSAGLNSIAGVSATIPQTNIVQVDVSRTSRSAQQWAKELDKVGIKTRVWEPRKLRCVTHRHISADNIARAVAQFSHLAEKFC